ncbi:MAG TPA: hypothetical protein VLK36_15205 [Gaiellaceae bacterium]|nr:hypothetical protein [Gaiellaceae bacterium]
MTHAERYLELGLRLGRHVDGLVDAYYGPPELKEQTDGEPMVDARELAADAAALLAEVPDGWLRDQVRGCATYARVLAGDEVSYSDEVEACYGVRPAKTPTSVYEAAQAELDELLPGDGSLFERRQAWRTRHLVDGTLALAVLDDLLPLLRERTEAVVPLPEGEQLTVEPVHDEPWWAFNYYLGDLRSRVVLNLDVPTTGYDLIRLAAHEVYPGHHTEHALKEQLLLRDRGAIEEGLQLVPTPQALLSEGIAEAGADVVLDDESRARAYDVLKRHGIEIDAELTERISKALDPLGTTSVDAALLIHEDGASAEEAQAYIERWRIATPEQAAHSVRFVTDPTWRAYTITYTAGETLCRAYVDGDPTRFRQLLTEHVRVGDLLAAG